MASTQPTTAPVAYKDIPGFPGYRVGDDGSVWSLFYRGSRGKMGSKWRVLRQYTSTNNYLIVHLARSGKKHTFTVHKLVLVAFRGERPEGMLACHSDDNRTDNRLSNLRWDSPSANNADAKRNGRLRPLIGESAPVAKLKWSDIPGIKAMHAAGHNNGQIAKVFGVSDSTISDIVLEKRWVR